MNTLADSFGRTVQVAGSDLQLRDITAADMAAVLDLHTLVFGADVDARWFDWKYGQGAHQGGGQAVGAWQGDALVAFCGGLPRRLWQGGRSVVGLQIGDVMVHPAWRGVLTRQGPFFHVSHQFYSSRLGAAGQRPFQLGFGFPSARHLRLAVLLGLLHDDGVMLSLKWPLVSVSLKAWPWLWRWQALDGHEVQFEQAGQQAWAAMQAQADGLLMGQRDIAYLRWRFVARPVSVTSVPASMPRYRFFGLRRRWSATWAGLAVLDLRGGQAHWLDWVGPVALLPLAATACQLEAARAGATDLSVWASAAVAAHLQGSGVVEQAACAGVGVPQHSALPTAGLPGSRWWLMGGDTDFL